MSGNFRGIALLIGSFSITLAGLWVAWSMMAGTPAMGDSAPTATPTQAAAVLTGTPAPPTAAAGSTTTPEPTPRPTLMPPLRTQQPVVLPTHNVGPGETVVFRIDGAQYRDPVVPDKAILTSNGTNVTLDTTMSSGEPLWVTWRLPAEQLPADEITRVDVRICGSGHGDFWEVYGPDGSEPAEHEVLPPDADGCWHFANAPGHDLSVIGGVMLRSVMTIDYIEFSVTFAAPEAPTTAPASPTP